MYGNSTWTNHIRLEFDTAQHMAPSCGITKPLQLNGKPYLNKSGTKKYILYSLINLLKSLIKKVPMENLATFCRAVPLPFKTHNTKHSHIFKSVCQTV